MHESVMEYARLMLGPGQCRGRRVIELGSRDVNGSVRQVVEQWQPACYIGVDLEDGPGVDLVADVAAGFEPWLTFDVVISTETLEHVEDWRAFVNVLKGLAAPGGLIFVTTRSQGFGYHPFPIDTWRYSLDDLAAIFADCDVLDLRSDPEQPGVFLLARASQRPRTALDGLHLYRQPLPSTEPQVERWSGDSGIVDRRGVPV